MKDDLFMAIIALIMMTVFIITGWSIGRQGMKREAIAAGVAHYTVNSTNGAAKFEFKKF